MLLRAAGPSLAAYGVTDALADPALDLYSGSSLVATNDTWSSPQSGVTAADVSGAALQAGAFPFSAGSADAALYVTLAPGAYTAIVRARAARRAPRWLRPTRWGRRRPPTGSSIFPHGPMPTMSTAR
jgi:hypothetical protein